MKFSFSVDIRPVSKARPRMGRYGTYTPSKTLDYEKTLRAYAIAAKAKRMPNPCIVEITCTFKKPKKSKEFYCTINRDVDNLGKAILDALNGVCFDDDKQVVSLIVSKNYGESDRVDIVVEYL